MRVRLRAVVHAQAQATCRNTQGSFACCAAGYTTTDGGVTCVDVDECGSSMLDNCAVNAACANTPGSFTCTCTPGYAGDGVVCV